MGNGTNGTKVAVHIAGSLNEHQATREELVAEVRALRESHDRMQREIALRETIVAERDQSERKLRDSEATLRKLFDENLDSMTIIDLFTGCYVDVNNEFVRDMGYSREEIIGKRSREIEMFVAAEDNLHFVAELKKNGVVRNMETTFRRKDGSTRIALCSAINLPLNGSLCCVTFTRDISAIKETQRQLIEAREAAFAASRAKSEFLSSMSHEIRTPMNAVLGMADLLWDSTLTMEQRRYLSIMRSNGVALLDLINDILDLAKVESGGISLEKVDFDIRELVDRVADTMGVRAHEKHIELAARVAPGVPENLVGDPLRLRQVMINLLGNAVKFTEHGEVVLTVEMEKPVENNIARLRVSVADTGIGIAPEKIGNVFSAFTQADASTTRKYGGSGLGLAIVKRLVELHQGEVSVESEPAEGSTFAFTAEMGVREAPAAKQLSTPPVDLTGIRTLVVDDTAANRLIMREILTAKGAYVVCVESGAAALSEVARASVRGTPYRVVLLDCRMPDMDGIEVAARINSSDLAPGDRPIIMMLTSDDLSATLARARNIGIDNYLVKPVKSSELLESIRQALKMPNPGQMSSAFVNGRRLAAGLGGISDGMSSLKILLADDSFDNRLLVNAFLRNTPFIVSEAEDGAAAFEKVKNGNYDLVLMDIQMPIMDGYTATRSIRTWEREEGRAKTPIIALTASAMEESVRKAREAGCDAHVTKPVKKATLIDAIMQAVSDAREARVAKNANAA